MLLGSPCVANWLEGLISSFTNSFKDCSPSRGAGRVSLLKAWENAFKRLCRGLTDPIFNGQAEKLRASALENFRIGDDLLDQSIALAHCEVTPRRRSLMGLLAFRII